MPTLADEILADSPTLYWKLEDTSETVATDSSGNGRDGTIKADVVIQKPGIIGASSKSMGLGDTTAAYISRAAVDGTGITDNTSGQTMEFFAMVNAQADLCLVTPNTNDQWHNYGETSYEAAFRTTRLGGVAAAKFPRDGAVHHYVVVRDVANAKYVIYIDGVEAHSVAGAGTYNLGDLTVGAYGAGDRNVKHWMSNFALYNTALSATRVKAHWDAAGISKNLVRFPTGGATASYSASSEYSATYAASKAADGTYPADWAANGTATVPWWQVDWTVGQALTRIVLRDRTSGDHFGDAGTITFSDGSSVTYTGLANDGSPLPVDFAKKTGITWFRVTSDGGYTMNPGFVEVTAHDLSLAGPTAVGVDTDFRWSVLANIGADTDLRWEVLIQLVALDIDLRWEILKTLGVDTDLRWEVLSSRSYVGVDTDLRWEVLQAALLVGVDTDLRWEVFAPVTLVGTDTDLRWEVLPFSGLVTVDTDLRWAVLVPEVLPAARFASPYIPHG